MNWIIRNTSKLKYHTNLTELFRPLIGFIRNYQWLISDLEFTSDEPLNFLSMDNSYNLLTGEQFNELLSHDMQFIWASIIGIPSSKNSTVDTNNLPYVEGNDLIWTNDNIQHSEGEIEVDCFDSSYTIIKFKNPELSRAFRNYFDEAIELEKYK